MDSSPWSFHNPVRVVFRPGAVGLLMDYVEGSRIALITSPGFTRRGLVALIKRALGSRLVAVVDDVRPNPNLIDVQTQGDSLRSSAPDALVALGGGSTIDTAKALARLLTQRDDTRVAELFLDAAAAPVWNPALPIVAIPTTSGTGAEVTPFGTVWDYERRLKYSVAGPDLYPKLAILDPTLTLELPEDITVSSGLDAVSHALESAWNVHANPVTLALVARSLQLSLRALPKVRENPGDAGAREQMMEASLLAGLAISQTRTALAHAISYPLTASFDVPHGLACSFTLPALLKFNAAADDGRLADLAVGLGCESTDELAQVLAKLLSRLEVGAQLSRYLPERQSVIALADRMLTPGRAENNLRPASADDVGTLVADALEALRV